MDRGRRPAPRKRKDTLTMIATTTAAADTSSSGGVNEGGEDGDKEEDEDEEGNDENEEEEEDDDDEEEEEEDGSVFQPYHLMVAHAQLLFAPTTTCSWSSFSTAPATSSYGGPNGSGGQTCFHWRSRARRAASPMSPRSGTFIVNALTHLRVFYLSACLSTLIHSIHPFICHSFLYSLYQYIYLYIYRLLIYPGAGDAADSSRRPVPLAGRGGPTAA